MRFFIVLFTLIAFSANAQVTIRITSLPLSTPTNPTLFIAGTFNNWNPGDSDFMFTQVGLNYEVTLPAQTGTVKFKVTQGSWQACEGTATGGQIADRIFAYSHGLIVTIQVAGWEGNSGVVSTALPNVKIVSNDLFIPQLNKTRKVWIYLPNNYDSNSTETYPVIYMHDGQNVFDAATSFSGEWGIDETLSAKEKEGKQACIVVAVDNGGASRIDEYSPFINPQYGGGQGDEYVSFLTSTLKPFIDSAYRTKTQREYTAIAGSSMGGLISLYAAIAHPEIYSKVGAFSPAIWFSDSLFAYVSSKTKTADTKFYFVAGQNESATMVKYIDSIIVLLKLKGFDDAQIIRTIKADGAHSEWFWKREFGAYYDWFFNDVTTSINILKQKDDNNQIEIYPNPTNDSFAISPYNAILIQLIDKKGTVLQTWNNVKANTAVSINKYTAGQYILRIKTTKSTVNKKFIIE
jgi:predicted alpha/beta superfamily hydrolase